MTRTDIITIILQDNEIKRLTARNERLETATKPKAKPMPIDFLDRGTISGFRKYMEARPHYFRSQFGDVTIEQAFRSATGAYQALNDGHTTEGQTQSRTAKSMARMA